MNTGDPAVGFRRRSGGSTTMPVQRSSDARPPLASDSSPPFNSESEQSPQTTADPAVVKAKPPIDAMAVLARLPQKDNNWGKARAAMDLQDIPKPAVPNGRRASFSEAFTEVIEGAIENRKQKQQVKQENSQYFSSSVVGSVNRQRRMQKSARTRMMMLLDEPRSSRLASAVFITMLSFIFVSVCLVITDSMSPSDEVRDVLWWIEGACSVGFCLEFFVRITGSGSICSVLSDVYMWIDFVSILPFIIDLVYYFSPSADETSPLLDALRLARLLRLLKLARLYEGSRVLIEALHGSVEALMAPLFFLCVSVILFAGALYHAEKGGPVEEDFDNIPKCAWFMLVTFSTVGYGDRTPGTTLGMGITSFAIVGGVLFMAMPITIVGSSFAQVWENKETKDVVRKMQELLLARGLRATDVLTVFHEFDTTNDGEIDIQEFKGALQVLGMKLGAEKARKLFSAFDKDHNQTVDFVEFCHVIFPDIDEHELLEVRATPLDAVFAPISPPTLRALYGRHPSSRAPTPPTHPRTPPHAVGAFRSTPRAFATRRERARARNSSCRSSTSSSPRTRLPFPGPKAQEALPG